MLIKEFENDGGFALLVEGSVSETSNSGGLVYKGVDAKTLHSANLVIELYPTYFRVVKNRYGDDSLSIPLYLLDDFLNHFENRFQYKSPILDNFNLTPTKPQPFSTIQMPVIKTSYPKTRLVDLFKNITEQNKKPWSETKSNVDDDVKIKTIDNIF